MDEKKVKTSFSLSAKSKRLLEKLAKRIGASQTGIIEMLIREEAEKKGVTDD